MGDVPATGRALDHAARLADYASLAVRVGVNVQPGQDVHIAAEIEHLELARAIAVAAYDAGARRVIVDYDDIPVRHAALTHAPLDALSSVPAWRRAQLEEFARDGAALIRLTGSSDPHAYDDIDPVRRSATASDFMARRFEVMLSGAVSWTIVAAPNAGWARQVFGEPDVERLWDVVTVAMRLDEDDPVDAWRRHRSSLDARARALGALDLDAVRYHGAGTDLTVGLIPGARWEGGSMRSTRGVEFMPNMPTEEVFTSPDRRRADGVMRLTRPLVMPQAGAVVENLEVRFADGRIVDVTASAGLDAARADLDRDEGARSLGEVALVDRSSRIAKAEVLFHDTLYDENAGSHVAWGQSFAFTVDGADAMSAQERAEIGLNGSATHTDVVIGGPGVNVDGMTRDGRVVPLIADDAWVLPTGTA